LTIVLEVRSLRRGGEMLTNDVHIRAQAGQARRDLALVRRKSLDTMANTRAPKIADNHLATPARTMLDHGGHQSGIPDRGTPPMMKSGQGG
jgi:hypothetical protein